MFYTILFLLIVANAQKQCILFQNQLLNINQNDLLINFDQYSFNKSEIISCLKLTLRKGLFDISDRLIDTFDQILKPQEIRIIIQNEQKILSQFAKTLILKESSVKPIMKWVQNLNEILFTFKLSHRWDSPPCLNSKSQKYSLQNNTFQYFNQCIVSRQRIYFNFGLKFYKDVHNDVEIKKDGVGTYVVSIKKKEQQIWNFLDIENSKIPIWGEMMQNQRFQRDMKQYFYLVDNITLIQERKREKK